jgi:SAM-dependent methyltransferase
MAGEWARGAAAHFVRGSVYDSPLPHGFSDLTMCQTLLMHLEHPEKALEEMVRMTRPGGTVVCMEPDNLAAMLSVPWGSDPEVDDGELIRRFRMNMIWARGRKKLGRGDWGIGQKLPKMMTDLGLRNVDVIHNDMPYFINPPYETEFQEFRMRMILENIRESEDEDSREHRVRQREWKECYLAGGGSLSTYYRDRKITEERWKERKPAMMEQLEQRTYFAGLGGSHFYCVFGSVVE